MSRHLRSDSDVEAPAELDLWGNPLDVSTAPPRAGFDAAGGVGL